MLSMGGLAYVGWPLIKSEYQYRFEEGAEITDEIAAKGFTVNLPSIKAASRIIENVDPWNQAEYKKALEEGVAHAKGSALPGESGTIFLFAHSSGNPLEQTRVNPAFFRLNRMSAGDLIEISFQGQDYRYQVKELKTVLPNEVEYLLDQSKDQLILQTCTPIGTDWNRLLVIAEVMSQ